MRVRGLPLVFHLGLIPSVLIVLSGRQESMRYLLWLGTLHVLLLYLVGRRLSIPQDSLAVQTLHKAGFLHTLMGLGAAVVAVALAWSKSAGTAPSASLVLIPIATALVPHILGVWFGHSIEMKRFWVCAPLEDLRHKAEESAHAALRILDEAQAQVKRFNAAFDGAINGCADATRRVERALEQLNTTTKNTAQSAGKMQEAVKEVSKVANQLVTVHRQIVSLLSSPLLKWEAKGERD